MPTHVVAQGEHLSHIAADHGFSDFMTLWDHPENRELKNRRRNPHVLMPGDELFIPERELKEETKPTEQRHRFKIARKPLMLRLVIKDFDNQPLADTKVQLQVEGTVRELKTDGQGLIETPIPPTAEQAVIVFQDPSVPFDMQVPVRIGYLDPVEEVSGQKARLRNLGYYVDAPEGQPDEPRLSHAVQEFQCDFGLPVDGLCGTQTQAKLRQVHGC
jgi:N-acetylmuramoyl-L-alanine amidase